MSRVDGGWLASGKPAVGAWLLLTERAVSFPRRRLSISDPSAGADRGGSIVSVALPPPPPYRTPPPPDSSCSKFRVLQSTQPGLDEINFTENSQNVVTWRIRL